MMDNLVRDEGFGHWWIQTYQPDGKNEKMGPFIGNLLIDSKLYIVKTDEEGYVITKIVVPSQNVAYVTNENTIN